MAFSEPHGFQFPDGMPDCGMCDYPANANVHVNPPKANLAPWQMAADRSSSPSMPTRAHSYSPNVPVILTRVLCTHCGSDLQNGIHVTGLPSGMPLSSNSGILGSGGPFGVQAAEGEAHPEQQVAFVAEVGHKLVFAAPGFAAPEIDGLPRQLAATFQRASTGSPHNLWIAGRYVEADRPNRNAAFWSTADLEIGQPSVNHGPLNWLHAEKEIIGAIVDSELVRVDREAAAAAGSFVGNHIAALAVVWPYIHSDKAQLIQKASEQSRLWFSMECISEKVSCLSPECASELPYGQYMREKETRCDHMRAGLPRRFVNPIFGGAAIIVPPVRPGWANADARVMQQAAALAERQAAAFGDLTTSEAEQLVASLLQNGE